MGTPHSVALTLSRQQSDWLLAISFAPFALLPRSFFLPSFPTSVCRFFPVRGTPRYRVPARILWHLHSFTLSFASSLPLRQSPSIHTRIATPLTLSHSVGSPCGLWCCSSVVSRAIAKRGSEQAASPRAILTLSSVPVLRLLLLNWG